MDFMVEFYETEVGACPVREFLDALKTSDPGDFAAVSARLTPYPLRPIVSADFRSAAPG